MYCKLILKVFKLRKKNIRKRGTKMKAFIAYRNADGSFGELEPLNKEAEEQEKTFSEKETDAFAHIVLDAMLRNKDKVKS